MSTGVASAPWAFQGSGPFERKTCGERAVWPSRGEAPRRKARGRRSGWPCSQDVRDRWGAMSDPSFGKVCS